MMNIIQLQDQLKNFSQEQLVKEMQMPSGNTPQYLVLGEIMRRKQMESSAAGQQAPQETVAQEAVAAAGVPQGGIADMARALAPKTDMAQNTGVQAMAKGGPVKKMNVGGDVMTDETVRVMANRAGMSIAEFLKSVGPERAAAITADAARRAASQTTGLANVFNESIPVRGTQTGSDEFFPQFGQVKNEALAELGANPTRAFGGADQYDRGMPELLNARETFAADNPFTPDVRGGPDDFRAQPARPSIFEEIGGTIGAITENYRNAQLRANRQEALGQGSEDRPLTAAEQAIADERKKIYGNIGETVRAAGQTIDDSVLGPAGAFLTEGRGLAQDAKALAATLIPGFEGAAISAKEQAELARQEAERLRQEGFFPNESGDPAVAKEAGAAKRSSDAYKQMADTMKEAGIANLAGNKLAPAAAPDAPAELPLAETTPTTPAAAPQGGGGGGGISGVSPYEQQLMDALASREKAATQDKWLALAQVGLNLMSSTNPTPLGALGEAGLKGVEAARAARDQYDKDKLDLQGAIEQSRMARAAAAAKAAAASAKAAGGLKLKDYLGQIEKTGSVARSTLELLTGGLDPESAMAAAKAVGDLTKQSSIKTAYDAALKADQDFQNAVRQIGGLPLSAEADDDTNIDATE